MTLACPLRLASAFAVLAGWAGPLAAAPIGTAYKVVRSGESAPMGFHYYVEHDCSSPGPVTMNLVSPPQHGEISVGPRTAHPSLAGTSANAACNKKRVRGIEVYYRSNPGYSGENSYVVERVFPNGDAQRFRITVSVR